MIYIKLPHLKNKFYIPEKQDLNFLNKIVKNR